MAVVRLCGGRDVVVVLLVLFLLSQTGRDRPQRRHNELLLLLRRLLRRLQLAAANDRPRDGCGRGQVQPPAVEICGLGSVTERVSNVPAALSGVDVVHGLQWERRAAGDGGRGSRGGFRRLLLFDHVPLAAVTARELFPAESVEEHRVLFETLFATARGGQKVVRKILLAGTAQVRRGGGGRHGRRSRIAGVLDRVGRHLLPRAEAEYRAHLSRAESVLASVAIDLGHSKSRQTCSRKSSSLPHTSPGHFRTSVSSRVPFGKSLLTVKDVIEE